MEAATTTIAHPAGLELQPEPRADAKKVGWLYVATGIALFALMGLLGLAMRLTQADAIGISAEWFYRLMTLHGAGMLSGALLAMMGGLWFVVRATLPVSYGRMLASWALIVIGTLAVLVSVVFGGFATGWTFLFPLPFSAAGAWDSWAAITFLAGMALLGTGFFVFCIDVLASATGAYGGFGRAIGFRFLRGRDDDPPPPQVIAATAVSTQGLLASAVGTTILIALLGRAADSDVVIDALWAKNLTYFFGHSVANLIIYLAAGMIYVLLPRYAGRPWQTTTPLAIGWLATLLLVTTAYSHHLYMDFVQPEAAQVISTVSSSAAALPVAVVTIYTGMMLVWGSRYRWTLASVLIYLGFAGWAIGGAGAVIDSLIPVNERFHNTLWVPAHFHTYLMLGVIFWAMAFLVHLLERAAGRTAARRPAIVATVAMVVGGYGLVGAWYASGALGIPRRFAVHPADTEVYSVVASIFVVVFAIGFLVFLAQVLALARDGLRRRRERTAAASEAEVTAPVVARVEDAGPPLSTPAQIGVAVAIAVAGLFVMVPPMPEASEANVQLHHLAHAVGFLIGAALGAAWVSSRASYAELRRRWRNAGLIAVLLAGIVMLALMVPAIYGGIEDSDPLHAAYHGAMIALGGIAGVGAALQGRTVGRLLLVLSVGMALMYAGGVTGG